MAGLSPNGMMEGYARVAVDFARQHLQVSLDFSEESLRQVEEILGGLHNTLPKGVLGRILKRGPTPNQIQQMATMWGGYVGEVIRRRWGGQWSTESQIQSGAVITLHIGTMEISPPHKVYKRLTNGPEDNIWHYYQVLKVQMEKKWNG